MSQEKTEKIIILGHSGSGKDFLRKKLIEMGLKYSPKFTTRPMRINEKNGEDYNFIDYNLYVNLHKEGNIKTSQSFNIQGVNWYYGVTKENWDNNQLFILTRNELEQLTIDERKKCFVVYLNIDKEIREKRLLERNDPNDSITRRIEADNKDFESFRDYDLSITDAEFEAEWIYDLMN
jgi:guanylate kinase